MQSFFIQIRSAVSQSLCQCILLCTKKLMTFLQKQQCTIVQAIFFFSSSGLFSASIFVVSGIRGMRKQSSTCALREFTHGGSREYKSMLLHALLLNCIFYCIRFTLLKQFTHTLFLSALSHTCISLYSGFAVVACRFFFMQASEYVLLLFPRPQGPRHFPRAQQHLLGHRGAPLQENMLMCVQHKKGV